jgi:acyl-CoA thioester hydrolase
MKDAGLTHGTFYSHFSNKDALLVASLRRALEENRPRWIHSEKKETWAKRLKRLSRRYLTSAHRDNLADSCALAALVSEAARANPAFRRAYEAELHKSIAAICGGRPCDADINARRFEETVMFMALCIGGLSLSRAVQKKGFSDQILAICRSAIERMVGKAKSGPLEGLTDTPGHKDMTGTPFELDQFPVKTYEKLRYADTDRQGHVNNAVFSTMLETGRVEILYDPDAPLASPGCAFVIASQVLDFHSEINWPGRVDIGTRVSRVGRSSLTLEQALFQSGRMPATAKTVIVQMNETTRRSEPLNGAAIERLNDLVT